MNPQFLLTLQDWDLIKARPVPPKVGRPLVGLDMGGGRSWSAAVALWPNGRCEAFALCPGIPSIEEQEKRDLEPPGTYQKTRFKGPLDSSSGVTCPQPFKPCTNDSIPKLVETRVTSGRSGCGMSLAIGMDDPEFLLNRGTERREVAIAE